MVYRFSSYVLDAERRTLQRGEQTVTLTPKVFQTLLVLVEHHDRVLSKDELCERIWPDQFVEEANLTQNISVLRRALGESDADRKHIVTFHGHGYRFVEPVAIGAGHTGEEAVALSAMSPAPPIVTSATPAVLNPPASPRRRPWIAVACALAAGICGWMLHGAKRSTLPGAPAAVSESPQVLTRMPGTQFEPAWAADGSSFAYVDRPGEAEVSRLLVQVRNEARPRVLGTEGDWYESPSWSPDNHRLAAVRIHQGVRAVVVLDARDGSERVVTSLFPHRYGLEYRHLDWSPDGSMLAVDDKLAESEPLSLFLIHLADGSRTRVTYPAMDIIGDVAPRFSPDGTSLAFLRIKYQGQNAVARVPVTGAEPLIVLEPQTMVSDVDWASNATLVFAARLDGEFRLWAAPAHGGAKPAIAGTLATQTPLQFSLHRGSGEVLYSEHSDNLDVWAGRIDTHSIVWRPLVAGPAQDVAPSFSPDGQRVAFRSDSGGAEHLWVAQADGSDVRMVDTKALVPAVHSWEPDSRTLMFKARNRAGLFEVASRGGAPPNQISSIGLSHPARSVDGRRIFARAGTFIYALDRSTGHTETLTSRGGAPIAPSADGRFLYFAQGRMETHIARLELNSHEQTNVLNSLVPGYDDCWALSARGIYHLAVENAQPVIAFFDFATHRDRTISAFPGDLPPVGYSGFTLSPDGHTLLVVRGTPAGGGISAAKISLPAVAAR